MYKLLYKDVSVSFHRLPSDKQQLNKTAAVTKMQEQCSEYFVDEDFVKKGQFKNDGSFETARTKCSEA